GFCEHEQPVLRLVARPNDVDAFAAARLYVRRRPSGRHERAVCRWQRSQYHVSGEPAGVFQSGQQGRWPERDVRLIGRAALNSKSPRISRNRLEIAGFVGDDAPTPRTHPAPIEKDFSVKVVRPHVAVVSLALCLYVVAATANENWPQWRGPTANGISDSQ